MKSCCDTGAPPARAVKGRYTIALIGQPNCGKTTLFNRLTGTHQTTGNWPGVTVERKEGVFHLNDRDAKLVDLPGVYSLMEDRHSGADEAVARSFLTCQPVDLVINVVDATALERQLFLTMQLLHMGLPVVVALNRSDLLDKHNLKIDVDRLSEQLGCPVVSISAYHNQGIDQLKAVAAQQLNHPCQLKLALPQPLDKAVQAINEASGRTDAHCWQALQWLLNPTSAPPELRQLVEHWRKQVENALGDTLPLIVADLYFRKAHRITEQTLTRTDRFSRNLTDRIDRWVLHPILGVPIFLLIMFMVFSLSVNLGNGFVDAFDLTAQALFVDGLRALLESLHAPEWLIAILADGIGAGVQVVASFIPVIAFLFLFLSILEESGYMQRAALLMDRLFQRLGLSGQAFVPLVVGFGCNVPAVMASRTLPDLRDRILTILMTPFMSCSARLTVYVLFASAFFSDYPGLLIFLLYLLGIVAAVVTALLLKHTLLPGEQKPLLIELPSYHRPTLMNLLLNARNKLKGFILDAGKVIVLVVLALNFFNSLGTDGTFGNENQPNSVLSVVGKSLTPVVEPLGVTEENWPATVGLFTGLLAKEVVVGTLDALYQNMDGASASDDTGAFDLWSSLKAAWATVPAYFNEFGHALLDPLGFGVLAEADAETLGVHNSTLDKMVHHFDGQIGAFAYLLLVLLYFPCVATFAAIKQELGWRWALFTGGWSLFLGYTWSVAFYQAATLPRHPESSLIWLAGIALAWISVILLLRHSRPSEPAHATGH